MPWKECKPMDERIKFIARLLDGEKMSTLCREFGISWPTGYKIFNRYKVLGLEGLADHSRRPYRHANQLPYQVERTLLQIKREHTSWGAPKIRDKLIREFPMIKPPARSTIHAVLDRHGLVKRRKRRRYKAEGTALSRANKPNALWCADYKQDRFDQFVEVYNNQRPHQALGGQYPGDVYTPSSRIYTVPDEPEYPLHDKMVRVTRCGRICIGRRKINLSMVFAGQTVGIREVEDRIWLVSFMSYDLGFFDEKEGRVEPASNPFVPEL